MKRSPILIFLAVVGSFFLLLLVIAILGLYALFGEKPSIIKSDAIGVIKIEGLIYESEPILKLIEKWKSEKNIKAVIIRIDSPGGVVGPSQEIYQGIKELREGKAKKVVVASLGSVGASGAYYIACGADRIIANPGSVTGSIGVIMEFFNFEKLYQWAKMENSVIKSGRYKDMGSPFRPMTEDEKELLRGVINNVYQQFKEVVRVDRKIGAEKIDEVTDGRIFTGEQAKQLGLVDELGNFQKAVSEAKKLAGIKGEAELIYPPKEKKHLLQYVLGESVSGFFDKLTTRQAFLVSPFLYIMPGFY